MSNKTNETAQNTDKEIWRENEDDYYSPSIHVTEQGAIGIDVGGTVIVKSIKDWHKLATNGGWINARISPPRESGRYWCVVKELNDLGISYFQWNCYYESLDNQWRDKGSIVTVTHYMPLMSMPELLYIRKI